MKKSLSILLVCFTLVLLQGISNKASAQAYCYPSFTGCSADSIVAFKFGTFVNSFTTACTGTADTSQTKTSVITVIRGRTYPLYVAASSTGKTDCMGAFIDFNKDGDFLDPGEMIGLDNNGNGLIADYNTAVTIPVDAKPQVTRMRVMVVNGAMALDYDKTCNSFAVGGQAKDYKITIAAYNDDLGIAALSAPQNFFCPATLEKVQIIITNFGLNSESNIPFTLQVGTTTLTATYNRTLLPTKSDTFTLGFVSAGKSGTYNFKIFFKLAGDGDHSNDTLVSSVNIKKPAPPAVSTIDHCGPASGYYLPGASASAGSTTFWFKNATTDTVFAQGDSLRIPYLSAGHTAYFAESRYQSNYVLQKATFSAARTNFGNFFDVFAKRSLTIDSFDVNFVSTTTDSAIIYYREGTYFGWERTPSAWTKLASIYVKGKGAGSPTRVPLPAGKSLALEVGKTYGIYIESILGCDYDTTGTTHISTSNADIKITAGAAVASLFAVTGSVAVGRDWHGTIYYHIATCNSERDSSSISIVQGAAGAKFSKGLPYQGQFNAGDIFDPDNICVGDTNTYQLTPPKGLTNADFGKKWTITNLSFRAPLGATTKDTMVKFPTSTKNGTFSFFPKSNGDSVFVLKFHIYIPSTGCDSVVVRYIHIRVIPKADFVFTNACQGFPVSFADSSKIAISSVSQWNWDFGDKTPPDFNKNPQHTYAVPGAYQVTLTSASAEGCGNTITKTVNEYPGATVKFGYVPGCRGVAINFLDSSKISAGTIVSWKWSFADGITDNTQNPTHIYKKSGPYNVKLVVTSGAGCKDSLTRKVTVLPTPIPKFTALNACVGAPVYMANTSIDSTNKSTYAWDFGDGGTSGAIAPSHVYNTNGTYNIVLKVTSKAGCFDTVSHKLTPFTKPTPKLTFKAGCIGQATSFVDSGGSPAGTTYNWDFGDGVVSSSKQNNTKHTYTKAGTFIADLSVTNAAGCIDSQQKSVDIIAFPKAGFTATTVCVGKTTKFTNTSTGPGILSYSWNFGDGTLANTTASPTHTYNVPGAYTVKLAAINALGCTDSSISSVTVAPLPDLTLWSVIKNHYTVTFTPKDSTIGNFTWYFGTNTNDSSSKKNPVFTYPTQDETYLVRVVVKNSSGCSATLSDSLFVGASAINEAKNTLRGVSVYPNPFEGQTNITYTLQARSKVNISIYDVQGKRIAELKDGTWNAGTYTDVLDVSKYNTSDGVYYMKMYVDDKCYTTRLVVGSK